LAKTHYEVLGVGRRATAAEIRQSYRKLVLKYHPDRSSDPNAADRFIVIVQAYETLIDAERRRNYDLSLTLQAERAEREARRKAAPPPPHRTQAKRAAEAGISTTAADLTRLTMLFSKGRFAEAELLARQIIRIEPRAPIPYAVLGDIARSRGKLDLAANMYAHAVQMDPRNPLYQQRHEELLRSAQPVREQRAKQTDAQTAALAVGGTLVLLACIYIALSREPALFPNLGLVNTWTLGLLVMLFLSGVVVGVSLSVGRMLDRFSSVATTSVGGVSPAVALGSVALVSYWAAAALYVVLGLTQDAFNYSTSRVMAGVALVVVLAALAAGAGDSISAWQVFLWGGNLAYLGGICGWMVTDSLRAE
jgi:tetratricopeptide (TPR) repeat protein